MSTLERTQARAPDTGRAPFLSVVVTARNDNHGGDLLYRMQVFVNALAAQCDRFALDAELILVEWNPPDDRPRLRDALEWPRSERLSIRIVTVPSELHRRLDYSDRLPLFQMIAKNVGIRRARGRFVLATNVDLVFSNGLMRFLARRRLEERAVYRVDRYDVECHLDPRAPIDEQLRTCMASVIRICKRDGTLELTTGKFYRIYDRYAFLPWWMSLLIRVWPYVTPKLVHRVRRVWYLALRLLARLRGVGRRAAALTARLAADAARFCGRHPLLSVLAPILALVSHNLGMLEPRRRTPGRELTLARLLGAGRRWAAGLAATPDRWVARVRHVREAVAWDRARVRLHTNASGDFTLMSREAWSSLRAYPELQIFSMHLDGLVMYMAHWAGVTEVFLPHPVFHLEHSHGFKPDKQGLKHLNQRLERAAIPQITNEQFLAWALEMFRERRPLVFNDDDWGFASEELGEVELPAVGAAAAAHEGATSW